MDRRAAIMAVLATFLAQLRFTRAQERPPLEIDLNQWRALIVKHGTHEVEIPVAVIFAELTREDNA